MLGRIAFLTFCFAMSSASPDRKDTTPPKRTEPKPPPFIGGPCNFGLLLQDGRKIEISGHASWKATGEIRKDGKLRVSWTRISDGRHALALYLLNADGSITGTWGYVGECQYDDEESLIGQTCQETLRAK